MNEIHLFGAANSTNGFYSHFNGLVSDSFQRVYILKGGPGTGKSTFLNRIAKEIQCPLEKYHCTAAADSLDGLVVPAKGLSLVDGTYPHRVDANLPGAVQQTLDFASCWDYVALSRRRQEIERLFQEGSRLFGSAYRWLKLAGDLASLGEEEISENRERRLIKSVVLKIEQFIPQRSPLTQSKKAFASALTGQGPVNFLPLLNAKTKIVLTGGNKQLARYVIGGVLRILRNRRLPVINLYCGFQPQRLEHLYIPGEFALVSSHQPHIAPEADYTIDLESNAQDTVQDQVDNYIALGIEKMAAAAKVHAELEDYYTPNVDFGKVDQIFAQTLREIRKLKSWTIGS